MPRSHFLRILNGHVAAAGGEFLLVDPSSASEALSLVSKDVVFPRWGLFCLLRLLDGIGT